MARKVRVEYAGAFYHVINRGNYRSLPMSPDRTSVFNLVWLYSFYNSKVNNLLHYRFALFRVFRPSTYSGP